MRLTDWTVIGRSKDPVDRLEDVRLPGIVLAEEHRERAGFELHVLDGPMSVEM